MDKKERETATPTESSEQETSSPTSNGTNVIHPLGLPNQTTTYQYRFLDYAQLWSSLNSLPKKKLKILKDVSSWVCDAFKTDYKNQLEQEEKDQQKLGLLKRILSWIRIEEIALLACKEESNAFGLYYNHKELPVDEVNKSFKQLSLKRSQIQAIECLRLECTCCFHYLIIRALLMCTRHEMGTLTASMLFIILKKEQN
jgi:hypothetical protein